MRVRAARSILRRSAIGLVAIAWGVSPASPTLLQTCQPRRRQGPAKSASNHERTNYEDTYFVLVLNRLRLSATAYKCSICFRKPKPTLPLDSHNAKPDAKSFPIMNLVCSMCTVKSLHNSSTSPSTTATSTRHTRHPWHTASAAHAHLSHHRLHIHSTRHASTTSTA